MMEPTHHNRSNERLTLDLSCRGQGDFCYENSLDEIRSEVKRFAVSQGFSREVEDITLAVQEACKNIIQHARPVDGKMHVECRVSDGRILIEVSDNGRGFDVGVLEHDIASPMAIYGRGIKLMKGLMDEFGITSGREGTTVRMEKKRS